MEKVKLKTEPEHILDPHDGPIGELLQYIDELCQNESELSALGAELTDLKKKLPSEFKPDGEAALDLDSPAPAGDPRPAPAVDRSGTLMSMEIQS